MKIKFVFGHIMMFFFHRTEPGKWDIICYHMGNHWGQFDYVKMIPRNNENRLTSDDVLIWLRDFKLIKL